MVRPTYNSNGNLIRYNNSPNFDIYGNTIQYQDDRSNPAMWDQTSGLRIGQTVVVTEQAGAAPAPGSNLVRVTTTSYDSYDACPILTFVSGRSISSLRSDPRVVTQLNVSGDAIASVDGESQNDSFIPAGGALLQFRERNKRRG